MIYTSGSSGQPKGVLVQHRGVCNLALAQAQVFGVSAESRVLQFASISFDAVVSELQDLAERGHALSGAGGSAAAGGAAVAGAAAAKHHHGDAATVGVGGVAGAADLPALRTVISAGEACSAELVAKWSSAQRQLRTYGPTEVTVCATAARRWRGSRGSRRWGDR